MGKKGKIITAICCSLVIAGAVAGVGVWQKDNIFKTKISADSSIEQPIVNPYENCGAYTTEGEEIKSWQALLSEGYIAVKDDGVFATEQFATLENVVLKIPASYKEIAHSGFKNCLNLVGVELPEGITTLHSDAFYNCSNLENVSYPESAIYVSTRVFMGCSKLKYYEDRDVKYLGNKDNNFVYLAKVGNSYLDKTSFDSFNEGCRVVGSQSFGTVLNLEYGAKLIFPKHIKSICAIFGGTHSIYIPETVVSLAYKDSGSITGKLVETNGFGSYTYINQSKNESSDRIFSGTRVRYNSTPELFEMALSKKDINTMKYDGLYNYEQSLTWQEILDNDYLFVQNGVLYSSEVNISEVKEKFRGGNLKIPEGITEISANCFKDFSIGFKLPKSLVKIGNSAFENTSMIDFDCPNVTYIGNQAFKTSSMGFNTFALYEGLEYIGDEAFSGRVYTDKDILVIPDSVEHIGTEAFKYFTRIKNFVFNHIITTLDMTIFPNVRITSIYIPSTVTTITFGDYLTNMADTISFYFESATPNITDDVSSIESKIKKSYTYEQYLAEVMPSA